MVWSLHFKGETNFKWHLLDWYDPFGQYLAWFIEFAHNLYVADIELQTKETNKRDVTWGNTHQTDLMSNLV